MASGKLIKAIEEGAENLTPSLRKLLKKAESNFIDAEVIPDSILGKWKAPAAGAAGVAAGAAGAGLMADKNKADQEAQEPKVEEPAAGPAIPARESPKGMAALSLQATPEQKKDKEKVVAAKPIYKEESPADYLKGLQKAIGNLSPVELPASSRQAYQARRAALQKSLDELKGNEKSITDRGAMAEIAETLGQALTQLGAGFYGMKHNVDMSGVKFNKTDWDARTDRALKRLQDKVDQVGGAIGEVDKAEAKELGKLEKDQDLTKVLLARAYFQGKRDKTAAEREQRKYDNQLRIEKAKREATGEKEAGDKEKKLADAQATLLNKDIGKTDKYIGGLERALDSIKNLNGSKRLKAVRSAIPQELEDRLKKEGGISAATWFSSEQLSPQAEKLLQKELEDAKLKLTKDKERWVNLKSISPDLPPLSVPVTAGKEIPATPEGLVTVIQVETGKQGKIPKEKLQAALDSGNFKLVE